MNVESDKSYATTIQPNLGDENTKFGQVLWPLATKASQVRMPSAVKAFSGPSHRQTQTEVRAI
jgi:hypothetical protein